MKKSILGVVMATFVMTSCFKPKMQINGEITGVEDGAMVYLEVLNKSMNGVDILDSVQVKKGTFKFEPVAEGIEYGFLRIKDVDDRFPIILEKGNVKAVLNAKDFGKSKITGTYNNEEFVKHREQSIIDQAKIKEFMNQTYDRFAKDSVVTPEIKMQVQQEYMAMLEALKAKDDKYIDDNPKSYLSVVLIGEKLLDPMADVDALKEKFFKLDKSIQETSIGHKVKMDLNRPPIPSIQEMNSDKEEQTSSKGFPEVGQQAPDFKAPDTNGNLVSLKESLGKVTIIDFWASWCGPCRKENPNMVSLYKKYSKQGLQIVGVSLDKPGEADKWKQAITVDKLYNWVNVSNLMHRQEPIARQYGINSIPATYILDQEGIIVAKGLRGKELEDKIQELLNK